MARRPALAALVLLLPAFAGCAEDAPGATGDPITPGGGAAPGGASPTGGAIVTPKPKSPSERWHFHDHWKGQPTLTLLDQVVQLNATTDARGLPALSALVQLAPGVIVPPETGRIDVIASWEGEGGALNVTYRPADANGFFPAGDLQNGGVVAIAVTESMADVPHRAHSLWAWNLSAAPASAGMGSPAVPPREVRVVVNATIGRPLFIDEPHVDWWREGDVLLLVAGATGEIGAAARTPAGNVTLPGAGPAAGPADLARPARVPADQGRIVPEGAKVVVALLNWTSDVPDAKLAVHYREANLPSEGPMTLAQDGVSSRVFVLPVDPDQTDTTYSNRTTWEFEVLPEGDASAFHGAFTLYAWVSRLDEATTLRETLGAR